MYVKAMERARVTRRSALSSNATTAENKARTMSSSSSNSSGPRTSQDRSQPCNATALTFGEWRPRWQPLPCFLVTLPRVRCLDCILEQLRNLSCQKSRLVSVKGVPCSPTIGQDPAVSHANSGSGPRSRSWALKEAPKLVHGMPPA